MPYIRTDELTPNSISELSQFQRRQIYNSLDCCITHEVHDALGRITNNAPNVIYDFERALQAPVLEMMQRGFRIDQYERQKGISELRAQISFLDARLQEMAVAVWGKTLNPKSPKQLIDFFYHHMRLPEQYKNDKGVRKLSTDREALEKLELYFYARPIVSCILEIRNLSKKLSVLETEIDPDGRMRTSYNIAGTETGRWSSSSSAFGTGTNLQNLTAELRQIFVSDPGYKLCGIDLEQAESREVGWQCGVLFDDWSYLDACYAGDLHTLVCKMVWQDLPWTGDKKHDRELADAPFYRHYSRRDLSKKLGHGSNYYGTPPTMARHAKITTKLAQLFQDRYFPAFPGIPKWHRYVAQQLQQHQVLTTPFGRTRHFFGRPNDDATLREAIAFVPQSSTGDRMNLALWRIWKHLRGAGVQLIAQVHDAVYFQYPERADEQEIISEALQLIDIRLSHNGRELIVPGEAKVGWNWGNWDEKKNPNGLKKFKGKDERSRVGGVGLNRIL
jgi:DNA polymerase-1